MHSRSGSSVAIVFIFCALIAVSVGVFFFYTLPHIIRKDPGEAPPKTAAVQVPAPPATAPPEPVDPEPSDPPAGLDTGSETPREPIVVVIEPGRDAARAVSAFAENLRRGVGARDALEVFGEGAATEERVQALEKLRATGDLKLDPDKPVTEIGELGERRRWALNLVDNDGRPDIRNRIIVDMVRGEDARWELARLRLPLRGLPGDPEPESPSAAADPLEATDLFVSSIVHQDFAHARQLVDREKLSEERVAALFIVMEDGEFVPREKKPIVTTLAQENKAWVVVRLQSRNNGDNGEFGLELDKSASEDGGWKISSINLSRLLAAIAEKSGATKVPYRPIVKNPSGGDSLAVFFEFDTAEIHPRALRQLKIISLILKSDPAKTINISGHTDAKGTMTYNERLSMNRAARVKETLLELGVDQSQIIAQGFGPARPLLPDTKPDGSDNPEGRMHNRRAEIFLNF